MLIDATQELIVNSTSGEVQDQIGMLILEAILVHRDQAIGVLSGFLHSSKHHILVLHSLRFDDSQGPLRQGIFASQLSGHGRKGTTEVADGEVSSLRSEGVQEVLVSKVTFTFGTSSCDGCRRREVVYRIHIIASAGLVSRRDTRCNNLIEVRLRDSKMKSIT
nr:unnamed protein product [Callosobruchus chinensis]